MAVASRSERGSHSAASMIQCTPSAPTVLAWRSALIAPYAITTRGAASQPREDLRALRVVLDLGDEALLEKLLQATKLGRGVVGSSRGLRGGRRDAGACHSQRS